MSPHRVGFSLKWGQPLQMRTNTIRPIEFLTIQHNVPLPEVEVIDPVLCKGVPTEKVFKALDDLATAIFGKHKENNFI
jgi:hypothetical protein